MGFNEMKIKYSEPGAAGDLEAIKAMNAKKMEEEQAYKMAKLKEAEEEGVNVMPKSLH